MVPKQTFSLLHWFTKPPMCSQLVLAWLGAPGAVPPVVSPVLASQHLHNDSIDRVLPLRYPIPEFATMYTPNGLVFRGEHSDGYPFLPEPRAMAFIAAAAYNCPQVGGRQ